VSALVGAAGFGIGLGIFTGLPLGVINVAIAEAVTAGRRRFAQGLGLGGALADAIHALLAFGGLGRFVTGDRVLVRVLAVVVAGVILGYAALAIRHRRRHAGRPTVATVAPPDRHAARGALAGFFLTAPNPAALTAWVAVAAAVWPDAERAEAGLIAGGVWLGSSLWFSLLARWIARVRPDHPALAWVPRVAFALLAATAVAGVLRALL